MVFPMAFPPFDGVWSGMQVRGVELADRRERDGAVLEHAVHPDDINVPGRETVHYPVVPRRAVKLQFVRGCHDIAPVLLDNILFVLKVAEVTRSVALEVVLL